MPRPVEAADISPQCTKLDNVNAANEVSYDTMYVSNVLNTVEAPTARINERSVTITEMYTHGDLNNPSSEPYDPNARYFEATFNPQVPYNDGDGINISQYISKPFFNLYVSRGWEIDPAVYIDVYSGISGLSTSSDSLIKDSVGYGIKNICPVSNGVYDCSRAGTFIDWPEYAYKNPAWTRGADTESIDMPLYYNYKWGHVTAFNQTGDFLGWTISQTFSTRPEDSDDSVLIGARNYRWGALREGLAARMGDGSDPVNYPFITRNGIKSGYFGNPANRGDFITRLAKGVGQSFSFRYNTMNELRQKIVKVRFKVTRDSYETGEIPPFFVGGSMQSYDKEIKFNRSIFKFESPYGQAKNYPIKIRHEVYASEADMNSGKRKPNNFGPPRHKLKIDFQGDGGRIPLQEVNYPGDNPVNLCYYYGTKRKVGSTIDPFSVSMYTAEGRKVDLKTMYNPFNPREYKLYGVYPTTDGRQIPFYIVPDVYYVNHQADDPRYGALYPKHEHDSRWTIKWIDPETVRLDKFTTQIPKEQKVVSPNQTVNPQIRALDTANLPVGGVNTRPVVTQPNGNKHVPYSNGLISESDGYLRSGGKHMPYSNTSQQGLYKVSVQDYKVANRGEWQIPGKEMLEPEYDEFLVSDKDKNLVAEHTFVLKKSAYVWNIDKSVWIGTEKNGKWVSEGELYRNGAQPGAANNSKGELFPNKFRLKVSSIDKAVLSDPSAGVSVISGTINLRYFPKANAPQTYTLSTPIVTIPEYPKAQCTVSGANGMRMRAFEKVQLDYSCYFPQGTSADLNKIAPQLAVNPPDASMQVFNYVDSKSQDSLDRGGQQLVTLRDSFADSTINNGAATDIDLSDRKYKGTWCADASDNSPTCPTGERIDHTNPRLRAYDTSLNQSILREVVANKPVISQQVMAGMYFQNPVPRPKPQTNDLDSNERLGSALENGKFNISGREIFYFYEIPSTTAPVTWKKQEQLLTNKAYACTENYENFSGFRSEPSTRSCNLAVGGTTSTARAKVINDFEDVLIRIRRTDSEGNSILNKVTNLHYDPAVCDNATEVRNNKPAMLATIGNLQGAPATLPTEQSGACFLPRTGSDMEYSMLLGGTERGYSDGKYSLKEKRSLADSLLLPEGLDFELENKEFFWLNGTRRSSEQKDGLAYVTESMVPVSVGNGVTERQKAFVINIVDMRKATLPATGGLGVYFPMVAGGLIMVAFAVYRYRFSKQ